MLESLYTHSKNHCIHYEKSLFIQPLYDSHWLVETGGERVMRFKETDTCSVARRQNRLNADYERSMCGMHLSQLIVLKAP